MYIQHHHHHLTNLLPLFILTLLLLQTITTTSASSSSSASSSISFQPHPHTGKLPPFTSGPPAITLTPSDELTLSTGNPVLRQVLSGGGKKGGRGYVVQDVHAPSGAVWGQIMGFGEYKGKVPMISLCEVYDDDSVNDSASKKNRDLQIIKTKMRLSIYITSLTFYIKHIFHPSLNTLTWTLDYNRNSDLNDSVGFWYVIPHPGGDEDWSRVYYSIELSMYDWVPASVMKIMSGRALVEATGWVKSFAEKEQRAVDSLKVIKEEVGKTTTNEISNNRTVNTGITTAITHTKTPSKFKSNLVKLKNKLKPYLSIINLIHILQVKLIGLIALRHPSNLQNSNKKLEVVLTKPSVLNLTTTLSESSEEEEENAKKSKNLRLQRWVLISIIVVFGMINVELLYDRRKRT